jgi:hypothetical protein
MEEVKRIGRQADQPDHFGLAREEARRSIVPMGRCDDCGGCGKPQKRRCKRHCNRLARGLENDLREARGNCDCRENGTAAYPFLGDAQVEEATKRKLAAERQQN